jgi:hypothetical protein
LCFVTHRADSSCTSLAWETQGVTLVAWTVVTQHHGM